MNMDYSINDIFKRIENLIHEEGRNDFVAIVLKTLEKKNVEDSNISVIVDFDLNNFLTKIFILIDEVTNELKKDEVTNELKKDETILISVKNQKLLRTCFQLVASLGLCQCLIPGLGVSLSKRSSTAVALPPLISSEEHKYKILVECTEFFNKSYTVPGLKTIINTFHLSDYLAALIQLSFAPLKKPGKYKDFIMTQEMYDKFSLDKEKYARVYEHLVTNCFKPVLMKELLVLQSVTDPAPPMFVKRTVAKEMSNQLLLSGGLLSLIRCFIDSYGQDTGLDWKKIDMICKIILTKHGSGTEEEYLSNISSQIKQILTVNNTQYLTTAIACVLTLSERYSYSDIIKNLVNEIFRDFDYDYLISKCNFPGTIILTPQEVERKINVFHACVFSSKIECPIEILNPTLYILFQIGLNCTNKAETATKIKEILIKCLESQDKFNLRSLIQLFLFGKKPQHSANIITEEYDAGIAVKCIIEYQKYPKTEAAMYFNNLFNQITSIKTVQNIFETLLQILIDQTNERKSNNKSELVFGKDDEPVLLDEIDENYATVLQLLSEISSSSKITSALKSNPSIVMNFIEYFIMNNTNPKEECVTISLILLNTILSNSGIIEELKPRCSIFIPKLKEMAKDETNLNHILCKEAISLLSSGNIEQNESAFGKAIADVFDKLLPVRAHGIMDLTKLIEVKDPETISKKHYVLCLLQDYLKHPDSYIYLSTINAIAALGIHCPEDVLQTLCKEFLQITSEKKDMASRESQNEIIELRMKVGDVIVKVTRGLGEMVVVHKTLLLNTMLCGCRDEEPFIRTSAISNLAELALILHYRIGTIIYELLDCIWSIIDSDKAIECRRAAVMVIASLLKGLGRETLIQLKDNLLPIYRTLKTLYSNKDEDSIIRLHAQIALEELNSIVNEFLFPEAELQKKIFVLDKPEDIFK